MIEGKTMGYHIEFNWVLKLSEVKVSELLERCRADGWGEFVKDEERMYPLRIPIDVVDEHWRVRARCEVVELQIGSYQTRGKIHLVGSADDFIDKDQEPRTAKQQSFIGALSERRRAPRIPPQKSKGVGGVQMKIDF